MVTTIDLLLMLSCSLSMHVYTHTHTHIHLRHIRLSLKEMKLLSTDYTLDWKKGIANHNPGPISLAILSLQGA